VIDNIVYNNRLVERKKGREEKFIKSVHDIQRDETTTRIYKRDAKRMGLAQNCSYVNYKSSLGLKIIQVSLFLLFQKI
jgi:hypothetical protein